MRCTKNELNFEEYINIEIESMVGRLRDFVAAGASIDSTGVSQFVDISHKTIPAILFSSHLSSFIFRFKSFLSDYFIFCVNTATYTYMCTNIRIYKYTYIRVLISRVTTELFIFPTADVHL